MLFPLWSLLKFLPSLKSTLYENVRILDERFPTSIIVPFEFKCRPSLCKYDAEIFLRKMTFFYLFQNVVVFLSMLFACFSSARGIDYEKTMFWQFWWNLFTVSLTFTNSLYMKFSDLYGLLLLPIWMIILSGSLLR